MNMECSVKYPGLDLYCRYLDADLSKVGTGRFCNFLKKRLKIEKLPCNLTVTELIQANAVSPSLLVKLPTSYFENWENYPNRQAKYRNEPTEVEKLAAYDFYISMLGELKKENFLHPYEAKCNEFVNRFQQTEIPKNFEFKQHSNGSKYTEYKAYFNYSTGYIFVIALDHGYKYIDKFLSPEDGKKKLIERISYINDSWIEHGRIEIFEKLSYYITAITIRNHRAKHGNFVELDTNWLADRIGYSSEQMEYDIEKLLILFSDWKRALSEFCLYKPAVELLRRDIYFLLEWLCQVSGKDNEFYFNKWSYNTRCPKPWAELSDVIEYEDFDLKKVFLQQIYIYLKEIPDRIVPTRNFNRTEPYDRYIHDVYSRLIEQEGFLPWIRAFKDLQDSINKRDHERLIQFRQTRILDYLLIITIRTEILIGSISGCDDRNIKKVFEELEKRFCDGSKERCLFSQIAKRYSKKTSLKNKPTEIIGKIEKLPFIERIFYTHEVFHCYKSILTFITFRNYFAHHCYKDDEINHQLSETAGKIMCSCAETVFIVDKAVQGCFL